MRLKVRPLSNFCLRRPCSAKRFSGPEAVSDVPIPLHHERHRVLVIVVLTLGPRRPFVFLFSSVARNYPLPKNEGFSLGVGRAWVRRGSEGVTPSSPSKVTPSDPRLKVKRPGGAKSLTFNDHFLLLSRKTVQKVDVSFLCKSRCLLFISLWRLVCGTVQGRSSAGVDLFLWRLPASSRYFSQSIGTPVAASYCLRHLC